MKKIAVLFIVMMISSQMVKAIELEYSGFLSVGLAKLDQPIGTFFGVDNHWSLDNDTVLGLQVQSQLNSSFGLTAQAVMRGYGNGVEDKYQPSLDWAYLSYYIKPGLVLRGGRLGLPWYYRSDHLDVGTAYPWVRPPADVYGQIQFPLRSFDGVDLLYQNSLGDGYVRSQFLLGRYSGEQMLADMESDFTWGGNLGYTQNAWNFSVSMIDTKVEIYFPMIQWLRDWSSYIVPLFPNLGEIQKVITLEEFHYTYWSASMGWEPEDWLVHSEFYYIDSDEAYTIRTRGWYLSVAKPIAYFTPYFVIGFTKQRMNNQLSGKAQVLVGEDVAANPGFYPDEIINNVLFFTRGVKLTEDLQYRAQMSFALGMRYDVTEKVDIKGEFLFLKPRSGSNGLMWYGIFGSDESVRVYSIVLDMTF